MLFEKFVRFMPRLIARLVWNRLEETYGTNEAVEMAYEISAGASKETKSKYIKALTEVLTGR